MLRHVILFKFYPTISREKRKEAFLMLKQLGTSIPEVREWSIGEQALPSTKAYDLAQISSFDDVESLEKYKNHPDHIRVRNFLSKLADWIVVDYEYV